MARLGLLVGCLTALAGIGGVTGVLVGAPEKLCAAPATPTSATVSFSEDILPLFQWRCASCHQRGGQGHEASGLDLTSYAGVMKGTKFGPMVIAGDPNVSNLVVMLDWPSHLSPTIRMPHEKTRRLSICDRDMIRTWIKEGARDN
jgi:hypothetical protein